MGNSAQPAHPLLAGRSAAAAALPWEVPFPSANVLASHSTRGQSWAVVALFYHSNYLAAVLTWRPKV